MLARVRDIADIMESLFPLDLAEDWDNVGLQIGSWQAPVSRVMVALDLDHQVLQQALLQKVDMIITHHPLFFKAIKSIDYDQAQGKLVRKIIEAGINVYAAHTNMDAGERGINQILAECIGLQGIQPLDSGHRERLYKLVVYVPAGHEDAVRQAVLEAGAGHLGRYADCSFKSRGIGTFLPLEGSSPFIGREGIREEVEEYRFETVVPQAKLNQTLQAMIQAHPYEEVAYDLFLLENSGTVFSLGRIGQLAVEMSLAEFCSQVKRSLDLKFLRVVGDMKRVVKKVAVVSGAGASFMGTAGRRGCDVLLTGDLKYHEARDAEAMGLAVVDAGHQASEEIICSHLSGLLRQESQRRGVEVELSYINNQECIRTF